MQDFDKDFGIFGKGIACGSEFGTILTYLPDQHDRLITELQLFAKAFGMEYVLIGKGKIYDLFVSTMIVYDGDESVHQACADMQSTKNKYQCSLQEYCGPDSSDSTLGSGSSDTSGISSGSSSYSTSTSVLSSTSVCSPSPTAASESNTIYSSSSSPHPTSPSLNTSVISSKFTSGVSKTTNFSGETMVNPSSFSQSSKMSSANPGSSFSTSTVYQNSNAGKALDYSLRSIFLVAAALL